MALDVQNEHQLIALAQQGEPEAIAAVLNYYFNEHHIWVKVGWEDESLILLCEALKLPPASEMGRLFEQILGNLHIERGEQAILYGRIQGEQAPCWHATLDGSHAPLDSGASGHHPESHNPENNSQPSVPQTASADHHQGLTATKDPSLLKTDTTVSQRATVKQASKPNEGHDRFLCCILDPDSDGESALDQNRVLIPVADVHTILHISATSILPVPYMAPCVLGLYRYRGQILWVIDLWQQLTKKNLSDRPNALSSSFITLITHRPTSNELLGFTIPKLSEQVYCCSAPQSPEASTFPQHMQPFVDQYDPVSQSPILSIEALIQDPRLQMHRASAQRAARQF